MSILVYRGRIGTAEDKSESWKKYNYSLSEQKIGIVRIREKTILYAYEVEDIFMLDRIIYLCANVTRRTIEIKNYFLLQKKSFTDYCIFPTTERNIYYVVSTDECKLI